MPAKRKNTRKKASSKKQADPSLKLVLKRLDKFDQRFDMLDRKIEAVDHKVDVIRQESAAEFRAVRGEIAQGREETAAEFKAVRGEMAQGLDAVRGEMAQGFDAVRGEMAQGLDAVRGEMAQGFDSLRHEFKTELQKEFENYGAKTFPIYARLESKTNALEERFNTFNQQFTGMEVMGKNYEQFMRDRDIIDAEHQDLKKDVDTLKKRDMEKAAAIDKIEKEIEKLKAA